MKAILGSTIILIEANTGAVWCNINVELAYIPPHQSGTHCDFTILVENRLLVIQSHIKQIIPEYDPSTYDIVVLMVMEQDDVQLHSLSVGVLYLVICLRMYWIESMTIFIPTAAC